MDSANYSKRPLFSKHDWVLIPLLMWVGLGVYAGVVMPQLFVADFMGYYANSAGFSSTVFTLFFFLMTVLVVLYFINIFMKRTIGPGARGIAYFFACGAVVIVSLIALGWTQECNSLGGGQEPCGIMVTFLFILLIFNYLSLSVLIGAQIVGIVSLIKSLVTK